MAIPVESVPLVMDPPGRWSALARLAVGMVLAMTTWFSASAVLPQLREEWELSSTAGSWLTIAVQLGFVVGADRRRTRIARAPRNLIRGRAESGRGRARR